MGIVTGLWFHPHVMIGGLRGGGGYSNRPMVPPACLHAL